MARRLIVLLAALLVLGFVVTGCGDDEDGGSNGSGGSDVAETEAATTGETATEETETGDATTDEAETETEAETGGDATSEGGGASAEIDSVDEAVEACKKSIGVSPQLSDDTKADLEELCERGSTGDAEDVRETSREVCKKVVADTLPAGTAGREAAIEACDKAGR